MESIVQGEREGCYICGRTPTEEHHIFGGPSRSASERYGLKVNLCPYHHRDSKAGVHFNPVLMEQLKNKGRECFVGIYSEEAFTRAFTQGQG